MKDIFSYDSPFGQFVGRILDCICLSLLWLMASVPVITAGAAGSAVYYTVHKVFRQEEAGVWKHFWKAFRENLAPATPVWLLFLAAFVLLGVNGYLGYGFYAGGILPMGILILIGVVAALVVTWCAALLGYLARFRDTRRVAAKNTVYMMIMHFPVTLGVLAVQLASAALMIVIPLGVAVVPAVNGWATEALLEPVFCRYMSEEDLAGEIIR